MKIISRFRDYYDTVSAQYLDKETIYKREHSVIEIKDREDIPTVAHFFIYNSTNNNYDVNFSIIGFCGQLIPVVTIKDRFSNHSVGFYNLEDLKKYVVENKVPIKDEGRRRSTRWWKWYSYDLSIQEIELFFQNQEKFDKLKDLFGFHNVPVFVVRTETNSYKGLKLSLNPMLANYSFAKIKDPYSAHQDLYTFIAGNLRQPDRPMIQISNQDKIDKHGFDKHSFRKMPTKKK